jgi:hypothetical protein
LRVAAGSGFVVTLLFVVLSIFPVIDVPNPASYAWKTVAVVWGQMSWVACSMSHPASSIEWQDKCSTPSLHELSQCVYQAE